MLPQLENYNEGSGAELKCPGCGGFYLQHVRVDVFQRAEDATTGRHYTIGEGPELMALIPSLEGNPSRRRGGISIHLECEACPAKSVLTIAQHKGNTLVDLQISE